MRKVVSLQKRCESLSIIYRYTVTVIFNRRTLIETTTTCVVLAVHRGVRLYRLYPCQSLSVNLCKSIESSGSSQCLSYRILRRARYDGVCRIDEILLRSVGLLCTFCDAKRRVENKRLRYTVQYRGRTQ